MTILQSESEKGRAVCEICHGNISVTDTGRQASNHLFLSEVLCIEPGDNQEMLHRVTSSARVAVCVGLLHPLRFQQARIQLGRALTSYPPPTGKLANPNRVRLGTCIYTVHNKATIQYLIISPIIKTITPLGRYEKVKQVT